ncbi:MAG: hypothetical protein ABGY96_10325 [bacterium]|nr:hypothetical protein [Gammaproteobacteria bacterium]HIL96177.1 hypothetical protein [Pseudomonadales bacterium]
MANTTTNSCKSALILLGIIIALSLLTGMTNFEGQHHYPGRASLVNLDGYAMRITSVRNAGHLCRLQLELEFGADLEATRIDPQTTQFNDERQVYTVNMIARLANQNDGSEMTVNCEVKACNISVSSLVIQ